MTSINGATVRFGFREGGNQPAPGTGRRDGAEFFKSDATGPACLRRDVRPPAHMSKPIFTLPLVFGTQGVMAWLFYRSRAVSHASWADSDFVVFDLPLVVGFTVSASILFFRFPQMSISKPMGITFGLSALGAVISSFVGTVIAFNLYGT